MHDDEDGEATVHISTKYSQTDDEEVLSFLQEGTEFGIFPYVFLLQCFLTRCFLFVLQSDSEGSGEITMYVTHLDSEKESKEDKEDKMKKKELEKEKKQKQKEEKKKEKKERKEKEKEEKQRKKLWRSRVEIIEDRPLCSNGLNCQSTDAEHFMKFRHTPLTDSGSHSTVSNISGSGSYPVVHSAAARGNVQHTVQ